MSNQPDGYPDHRPDIATYALGLLAEELGEVAFIVGEVRQRIREGDDVEGALTGMGMPDPITGHVHEDESPRQALNKECGDVLAAIGYGVRRGILDEADLQAARLAWLARQDGTSGATGCRSGFDNAGPTRDATLDDMIAANSANARVALASLDDMVGIVGRCVQLVGKSLRFGLDVAGAKDPNTGEVIGTYTPRIALTAALGEMVARIEGCAAAEVVAGDEVRAREIAKMAKLLSPDSRDNIGRRLAP